MNYTDRHELLDLCTDHGWTCAFEYIGEDGYHVRVRAPRVVLTGIGLTEDLAARAVLDVLTPAVVEVP